MKNILTVTVFLLGAQAFADNFSSYTMELLKKASDSGCQGAYSLEQKADPTDPKILKCTEQAAKITKKIVAAPLFVNSSSSDKVTDRMQAFLTLALCQQFTLSSRKVACFRNSLSGSSSDDLIQIEQTALTRSKNFLMNQSPIYIYVKDKKEGVRTETGEQVFEDRYNYWMKDLLKEYAKTLNPDPKVITNKHPDLLLSI